MRKLLLFIFFFSFSFFSIFLIRIGFSATNWNSYNAPINITATTPSIVSAGGPGGGWQGMGYSDNRRIYWDGTYYWFFILNGTDGTNFNITYNYFNGTSFGPTWNIVTGASPNVAYMDAELYGNMVEISYVVNGVNTGAVKYINGTISGTTITWRAPVTVYNNPSYQQGPNSIYHIFNTTWIELKYAGASVAVHVYSSINNGSTWVNNLTSTQTDSYMHSGIGQFVALSTNQLMVLWSMYADTSYHYRIYTAGGTWGSESTFGSKTGTYEVFPSCTNDNSNNVQCVYQDSSNNLIYQNYTSSWGTTYTIDTGMSAGQWNTSFSITVDQDNNLFIYYFKGSARTIRWINRTTSGWSTAAAVSNWPTSVYNNVNPCAPKRANTSNGYLPIGWGSDTTGGASGGSMYVGVLTTLTDNPPQWVSGSNSTNTTVAGVVTLFSLNNSDDHGLSGYIFSFYNGSNTILSTQSANLAAFTQLSSYGLYSAPTFSSYVSPSSSGKVNNSWTNPSNVQTINNVNATIDTRWAAQDWYNFPNAIPWGSSVWGINLTVLIGAKNATAPQEIYYISSNGGSSYVTLRMNKTNGQLLNNVSFGGPTNMTGLIWNSTTLNDTTGTRLLVKATKTTGANSTINIDWMGMIVNYSAPTLNYNTSYQTYNGVSTTYFISITNISVIVNVSAYNNTASTTLGTSAPDLWLEVWDGSLWSIIGNFSTTSSLGNFTLFVPMQNNIYTGWLNTANRNIRIRGVWMDFMNESVTWDNISYTNVWVNISGTTDFVNDTWTAFSGGSWSNVTKTVNSTTGASIQWKTYFNDSINQWNSSSFSYLTTSGADNTAPIYSNNLTNSTTNGTVVQHDLNWTDNVGLSGYIFSFDNCTGTMTNDTWIAFSAGNWSNVSKTTSSTAGCTIKWCVYANDTSNNWNGTSCVTPFSYITTSNVACVGTVSNSIITFSNVSSGKSGDPVGQSDSPPMASVINVTITSGTSCKVGIYSVANFLDSLGRSIDPSTNEKFVTNMATAINWAGVTTYVPVGSANYPANCTGMSTGQVCSFFFNLTVPTGSWGSSYSSNLTVVVSS